MGLCEVDAIDDDDVEGGRTPCLVHGSRLLRLVAGYVFRKVPPDITLGFRLGRDYDISSSDQHQEL